jgi:membrane peptidoglycan carboxypeptidase
VQTARTLQDMMEGVVEEGTGERAAVTNYRIAGKSGTAQKAIGGAYSPTDYMASFGGFGPLGGRPRLVALVVLDSPRGAWVHGGQVAAPVFGRIMSDGLRHLRAAYDRPAEVAEPPRPATDLVAAATMRDDTLARPVQPGIVPELIGLGAREAVARLAVHGYRPVVTGSGRVVSQSPAAGTPLPVGERCSVTLGRAPREASGSEDRGEGADEAAAAIALQRAGGAP